MVSIKHFILFSTLFCWSSATPEGFSLLNIETLLTLKGDFPWYRISVVPYSATEDNATLFKFNRVEVLTYTFESVEFKGQFINCLGKGIPCHLFNIPTPFKRVIYSFGNESFVDSNGLKLTVGKTKENYVSLEEADYTLNQHFG